MACGAAEALPGDVVCLAGAGEGVAGAETLDAVVELAVPDDVVVQRLLGRGRTDDTEDVIRRRQQVYRDATAPLLDFYRDRLVSVDAVGDATEIGGRILEALGSRVPEAAAGAADR